MPLNSPILIETRRVTATTFAGFLDSLQDCWKCTSLLWMQANSFPVLPGIILSSWSDQSERAVQRFCREKGFSELLVRIEEPGQRWTRRRGGYTIPMDEARSQVEELANEGMLAMLLEPASPYLDLFSLTSACDLETGKVDVEVVGAGFDASDILRSDLLPHERFEVFFGRREQKTAAAPSFQPKRMHLVGPRDYKESVRRRLIKIGARLQSPAFPNEVVSAAASGEQRAKLAEKGLNFLRMSGQTALLEHMEEYEPIPSNLLNPFLGELLRLFERARAAKLYWRTLSLAASFLPGNRLVLWDFFPPGENDTRVLYRL